MLSSSPDLTLVFSDGELLVHSHVLVLSTSYFRVLLSTDTIEVQRARVEVKIATKEEFSLFYQLLKPFAWDPAVITNDNFEFLLRLSAYYDVPQIQHRCADVLKALPASVPRLLIAHEGNLWSLYNDMLALFARDLSPDIVREMKPYNFIIDDLWDLFAEHAVTLTTKNVEGAVYGHFFWIHFF